MGCFYQYHQLALLAGRGGLLAFIVVFNFAFSSFCHSMTVTISATNNAPNNCGSRTVSVAVAGGSGDFAYFWSSEPASSVNLGSGPSITVSPAVATTYTAAVRDKVSGEYMEKSILVSPVLRGTFSLFIPNAFLEGSLWRVLDSGQGTGPLNAYQYDLSIIDDWGNKVYSTSRTVTSGSTGLLGGEVVWNGRLNGTGSYVPAGNYFYDFRLVNCSNNQLFRGTITFFRSNSLSLEVYPNPAQDYVELSLSGLNHQQLNRRTAAALVSAEVQLTSSKGDVLLSEALSALPVRIDVSMLPEDTYSLRLLLDGHVLSERLRIQR